MDTHKLLLALKKNCIDNSAEVKRLKGLDFELLNHKASVSSWSALECIEHLNFYGVFYLPEIDKRIKNSPHKVHRSEFLSSWLGNYFAKAMLPKEKLNEMKTFKSMNPSGSTLSVDVLDTFIQQQEQMCQLLENAKKVDLNKTKTAISISKFIKLRLGDTFRVVIYHNQRHVLQALRAIEHARKAMTREPVTQ